MYKIILALVGLTLMGLLFFTQTKEKTVKITKTEKVSLTITQTPIVSEPIEMEAKKTPILTPFKPLIQTMPTTISNEEIAPQNIDELQLESFKEIQPKIHAEMLTIPECLENAESKEAAFACNDKIRLLSKELAISMGDFSDDNITGYDEDFVWDEETKLNMIKELENSHEMMQDVQTCIQAATTTEELEKCLRPSKFRR